MARFLVAYLAYLWGVTHHYFGNKNSVVEEYAAAVAYFSRALRIDPSLRKARLSRGVLLWRELDRPAEAIADFDFFLAADPVNGEALFNRAMARQALGQFNTALQDLEAYLELSPDDEYRDVALRTAALLREIGTA